MIEHGTYVNPDLNYLYLEYNPKTYDKFLPVWHNSQGPSLSGSAGRINEALSVSMYAASKSDFDSFQSIFI